MRPGSNVAAFCWGLAEATVFFIVPDVLLSAYGLSSLKKAVLASVFAALGASIGGLCVALAVQQHPETAFRLLAAVPGISETSFERARELLSQGLFPGLIAGAFSGLPYKILAAETAVTGTSAFLLAALTPFARLPRFLLASLASYTISRAVGRRLSLRSKLAIWAAFWVVFYVFYFYAVGFIG
ncbi:hypothetical protein JM93_01389 [Roseibium hamelinense]|uniref:Membrane protein YqaA with SNARE-associated domain n=1 Tax=Roseibium hamelinense TaxID=150831 RepID=A0A562TAX6_9HYPH|nr:hypothetical protein [Roseibium hamelinense]MTI45228.1 hypothetical protein [Roseibium hamelinense]TWI90408.1 hypothetical protein JM93_01389 [Roseibium hamelinense]